MDQDMKQRLDDLRSMISVIAARHELRPALVAAIAAKESGGQTGAVRYEPDYPYLVNPAKVRPKTCSTETEKVCQKISWGVMQIMGATAREMGFNGWIPELIKPELSLEFACRYLARLTERYGTGRIGGEFAVVAAYNAGSPRKAKNGNYVNQAYVDDVFTYRQQITDVFGVDW
jgi:soluble lytic murein transglycosylase-like protein